jgi:hypothetical protein
MCDELGDGVMHETRKLVFVVKVVINEAELGDDSADILY